jgi:serine/threonine protein kinase
LWAFGVTLFELLAGYNPFSSPEPMERYKKILRAQVSWPSYMNIFAREFIEKLLVTDAKQRIPVKWFKNYYLFKVCANIGT